MNAGKLQQNSTVDLNQIDENEKIGRDNLVTKDNLINNYLSNQKLVDKIIPKIACNDSIINSSKFCKPLEKKGILEQINLKSGGENIKNLTEIIDLKDYKHRKDINEIGDTHDFLDLKEKNFNLRSIIFPNRLRNEQIRHRSRAKDNEKELQLIAQEIIHNQNEKKILNSKIHIIKLDDTQYKANIELINNQSCQENTINPLIIPATKVMVSSAVRNQNQIGEEALNKILDITEKNEEKIDENNVNIVKIEDVPMSIKYSNLLQESRELTIPIHYKEILVCFENLNLTLNYFKYQNRLTIFEEIQKAMQIAYKQYT